jgi:hypothetical protein
MRTQYYPLHSSSTWVDVKLSTLSSEPSNSLAFAAFFRFQSEVNVRFDVAGAAVEMLGAGEGSPKAVVLLDSEGRFDGFGGRYSSAQIGPPTPGAHVFNST